MTPRERRLSAITDTEAIPRTLRQAVIKIMAEKDLDWSQACEVAAMLIDSNGKEFQSMVKREADRTYKSRFMSEMNKARVSVRSGGYWEGYADGNEAGKKEAEITYRCNLCNEPILMLPNSESHKAMVQYMYDHGWGHSSCHEKNK